MSKLLGELLIEKGKITNDQLKTALGHHKRWGKRTGEALVELGLVSEKDLCETLSDALKMPLIDLTRIDPAKITRPLLQRIPMDIVRSERIVPVSEREIKGKVRLVIATSDPTNKKVFDQLRSLLSLPIVVMISPDSTIEWFIRRFYLNETEALPKDFKKVLETKPDPDFVDDISSIFTDIEFTNTTKIHRKKFEKKD